MLSLDSRSIKTSRQRTAIVNIVRCAKDGGLLSPGSSTDVSRKYCLKRTFLKSQGCVDGIVSIFSVVLVLLLVSNVTITLIGTLLVRIICTKLKNPEDVVNTNPQGIIRNL